MVRPRKMPPTPEDGDQRKAVILLKGSNEYVAWLEAAHRKTHIAKATIVRLAIADWAAKNGLPEPPEI